jgi:dCMP deaminase
MPRRPDLGEYALLLADAASSRSEDPHRRVGCAVLGDRGQVLSLGYNGPPAGVDLKPGQWADRELVRLLTIHAEANALRYVRPGEGALLASTYQPCAECVKLAVALGIHEILYAERSSERWRADSNAAAAQLGVDMVLHAPAPWER